MEGLRGCSSYLLEAGDGMLAVAGPGLVCCVHTGGEMLEDRAFVVDTEDNLNVGSLRVAN
jgi:hypothetical protein